MKLTAIILLALLAGTANATFKQLKETCRTSQGLGICVQSELCCTAVGGSRGDSVLLNSRSSNEVKEVDITISAHNGDKIRAARSVNDAVSSLQSSKNKLSARAAQQTAFPDELQERQVSQSFDCSYGGICCVLPAFSDYDCSTCGLWGDGVRTKVTTPRPVTVPVTTTTSTPLSKKILPRIVGGTDAPRNRWCWQVGILDANGLVCGGALIARNWVISAAHCVAGRFLDEIIVVLGMYDFVHSDPSASVYYHNPTGAIIHYGYDPSNYNNDIVLLRIPDAPCGEPGVCTVCLGGPVSFVPVTTTTSTARTVTTTTTTTTSSPTTTYSYGASYFNPLTPNFRPQDTLAKIANQISASLGGGSGTVVVNGVIQAQNNPYSGLVCVITGWGSTGTSPVAPVLQEAWQQIITPQQCESDFQRLGVPEAKINLPDSSFCSRGLTLTESSCVGDGGSPLVCQSHADHSWSLWGVIILGSNMCMPGAENGPTISINVGNYLPWIRDAVQGQLPSVDTTSGRNAYKIPLCGINFLRSSDPVTGGCPRNLHVAGQGVRARGLLVTGGQEF